MVTSGRHMSPPSPDGRLAALGRREAQVPPAQGGRRPGLPHTVGLFQDRGRALQCGKERALVWRNGRDSEIRRPPEKPPGEGPRPGRTGSDPRSISRLGTPRVRGPVEMGALPLHQLKRRQRLRGGCTYSVQGRSREGPYAFATSYPRPVRKLGLPTSATKAGVRPTGCVPSEARAPARSGEHWGPRPRGALPRDAGPGPHLAAVWAAEAGTSPGQGLQGLAAVSLPN